jgi:hypothetical protein
MYNGKVTGKTHVCRDTTQIKYVASPVTARGYPPCADLGGARARITIRTNEPMGSHLELGVWKTGIQRGA